MADELNPSSEVRPEITMGKAGAKRLNSSENLNKGDHSISKILGTTSRSHNQHEASDRNSSNVGQNSKVRPGNTMGGEAKGSATKQTSSPKKGMIGIAGEKPDHWAKGNPLKSDSASDRGVKRPVQIVEYEDDYIPPKKRLTDEKKCLKGTSVDKFQWSFWDKFEDK